MTTSAPTNCQRCNDSFSLYAKTYSSGLGIPGYAVMREQADTCYVEGCNAGCGHPKKEVYICYKCASADEVAFMKSTGRTALYLTYDSPCNNPQHTGSGTNLTASDYKVGDWPGLLSIRPTGVRKSKTFIPRVGYRPRYDVWFVFDGYYWHGVKYGDMTDIVHCKRTKEKFAA